MKNCGRCHPAEDSCQCEEQRKHICRTCGESMRSNTHSMWCANIECAGWLAGRGIPRRGDEA